LFPARKTKLAKKLSVLIFFSDEPPKTQGESMDSDKKEPQKHRFSPFLPESSRKKPG
jgi:hypothetical protein